MLLRKRPHPGPAVARRLLTSFWPVRIPTDFLEEKTVAVAFSGGQALPPGTPGWVGPLLPARGSISAAPPFPQPTPPPAPRESMNFGSPAPPLTQGLRRALLPWNLAVAASCRKPFSFLTPCRCRRSPTVDSGSDVLRPESCWLRFSQDRWAGNAFTGTDRPLSAHSGPVPAVGARWAVLVTVKSPKMKNKGRPPVKQSGCEGGGEVSFPQSGVWNFKNMNGTVYKKNGKLGRTEIQLFLVWKLGTMYTRHKCVIQG